MLFMWIHETHCFRPLFTVRQQLSHAVLALLCIWLNLAVLFATSECGLSIPHQHRLIGSASQLEMEAIIHTEQECHRSSGGSGETSATPESHGTDEGLVLHVVSADQAVPVLTVVQPFAATVSAQLSLHFPALVASLHAVRLRMPLQPAAPPPEPPPE
jgi:hypothetical protein